MKIEKTIQAAAVLVGMEHTQQMGRLRLLKLLYITDRECLRINGRPVTFDRAVAMRHGPVLSGVYDLIKGEATEASRWSQFFRNDGYHVELIKDPGRGALSRFEIGKLREVFEERWNREDWDVAKETEAFQEFMQNRVESGSGSSEIPLPDILDAVGRTDDKNRIMQDIRDSAATDRFFSSAVSG